MALADGRDLVDFSKGSSDGATTLGSNVLTSSKTTFLSSDVGGFVTEDQPTTPQHIPPQATIQSVVDAHTVRMSAIATAAGGGISFHVTGSMVTAGSGWRATQPCPACGPMGTRTRLSN